MEQKTGFFAPLLDRLPRRLQWTAHNLVARPIGEVIYVLTGRLRERADGRLRSEIRGRLEA